MKAPRTEFHLRGAKFFLGYLRLEEDPRAFAIYLSAFLNSTYLCGKALTREAQQALQTASQNKKGAGQRFIEWLETWERKLSPDDTAVWTFMSTKRGDDAYHEGVEPEIQSVLVPRRPSERMLYYTTGDVLRSAQKHYFHFGGQSYEVYRVCERYLALLESRLKEFLAACLPDTVDPRGPKGK